METAKANNVIFCYACTTPSLWATKPPHQVINSAKDTIPTTNQPQRWKSHYRSNMPLPTNALECNPHIGGYWHKIWCHLVLIIVFKHTWEIVKISKHLESWHFYYKLRWSYVGGEYIILIYIHWGLFIPHLLFPPLGAHQVLYTSWLTLIAYTWYHHRWRCKNAYIQLCQNNFQQMAMIIT